MAAGGQFVLPECILTETKERILFTLISNVTNQTVTNTNCIWVAVDAAGKSWEDWTDVYGQAPEPLLHDLINQENIQDESMVTEKSEEWQLESK